MKSVQKIISFCCIYIFILLSSASAQGDYFIIDSVKIEGVHIRNQDALNNSKTCEQIVGDGAYAEVINYTPDQIKEYGFADGTTYFSREIIYQNKQKWVFLERLYEGQFTLFVLPTGKGRLFFLEANDIEITALTRDNYSALLMNVMSDCPAMEEALKLVKLKKYSLLKLLDIYENCELRAFPSPKWGIMGGLSIGTLKAREIQFPQFQLVGVDDLIFNRKRSISIGLFADLPINASDFSIHLKLYLNQFNFAVKRVYPDYFEDIQIDFTSVNFPFLYRYTFAKGKIRPFINGGGIFSSHIKNTNTIFQYTTGGSLIEEIELIDPKILHDNYLGYTLGGGLVYSLNHKHSLFLDLLFYSSAPLGSNLSVAKQSILAFLSYSF